MCLEEQHKYLMGSWVSYFGKPLHRMSYIFRSAIVHVFVSNEFLTPNSL